MLRRYFAKRLLVAAPSLLIASLIVFTLPRLIPGDVVALMLEEKAYAKDLAIWWGWRPVTGFTEFSKDAFAHVTQFILPAFILGIAAAAALMRLTRGTLLEVLRQDYVRTAWAKGLSERRVVLKHSLRNGIIPVVSLLGTQIPQILGGTVIIETIFGLPGMGRFLFDAINQRDYPVIQGVNLIVVSFVVFINLTVDTLYAVLDPRIRY